MRITLPSLLASLLALGACGNRASSATAADAGEEFISDDGSTAGCTSVGGTCVPYSQACPLPQQNSELCGSTVLLCCLPPGGGGHLVAAEAGVEPDSGGEMESGSTDGTADAQGMADASDD